MCGKAQAQASLSLRCHTWILHVPACGRQPDWHRCRAGLGFRTMAKQPSIEDQFTVIEEAIAALEAGDLGLEDALARYEAGLKSVRQAKAQLDRFTARLEELRGDEAPPQA